MIRLTVMGPHRLPRRGLAVRRSFRSRPRRCTSQPRGSGDHRRAGSRGACRRRASHPARTPSARWRATRDLARALACSVRADRSGQTAAREVSHRRAVPAQQAFAPVTMVTFCARHVAVMRMKVSSERYRRSLLDAKMALTSPRSTVGAWPSGRCACVLGLVGAAIPVVNSITVVPACAPRAADRRSLRSCWSSNVRASRSRARCAGRQPRPGRNRATAAQAGRLDRGYRSPPSPAATRRWPQPSAADIPVGYSTLRDVGHGRHCARMGPCHTSPLAMASARTSGTGESITQPRRAAGSQSVREPVGMDSGWPLVAPPFMW